MASKDIFPIIGQTQNYPWGKQGYSSVVAQLQELHKPIKENESYAELWMGTHCSGPATIQESNENLSDFLKKNCSLIGDKVQSVWPEINAGDLPYLFKILSIQKALSIQAHPDKKLAEQLFQKHPDLYKDPNHKPELAMALDEMEALCGFRPINEIQNFLNDVPELRNAIDSSIVQKFLTIQPDTDEETKKTALKDLFSSLMKQQTAIVEKEITTLVDRIHSQQLDKKDDIYQLAVRLNEQFPKDIGILSAFLLNYIKLKSGDALFLCANEPHAYLSGECAECMACSDNVVRAGLTPKYKDVETLCSMLTYNHGPLTVLKGEEVDQFTRQYVPPIQEFKLQYTRLPQTHKYQLPVLNTASILLVYQGKVTLKGGESHSGQRGSIFFIGANARIEIEPQITDNSEEKIELLRCSCNLD